MNNFRVEKDKSLIIAEISDVRAATDEVGRSKVSLKIFNGYSLIYLSFISGISRKILSKSGHNTK